MFLIYQGTGSMNDDDDLSIGLWTGSTFEVRSVANYNIPSVFFRHLGPESPNL